MVMMIISLTLQSLVFTVRTAMFDIRGMQISKHLQLICTIKRTIFRKVRTETILKIYNTLVLPTFLCGSENWTLTTLQRQRIEAAEMKLLRPLAGYPLYDHKTNELEIHTEIL